MSDEAVAGRGTSLFGSSMSCGDEGDELAILPIAVSDFVSLLNFFSSFAYPSDHLVTSIALYLHACYKAGTRSAG
jgi:hypothetical protein